MKGTVVTLDGGGFSLTEDGAPVIDDCLLALTGSLQLRGCCIRPPAVMPPWPPSGSKPPSAPGPAPRCSPCSDRTREPDCRGLLCAWISGGECTFGYAVDDYAAAVLIDGTFAHIVADGGQLHALRLAGGLAETLSMFGHDGTRESQ